MENVLQLEKVSFSYGNSDAVKNISLIVKEGDFVGLIGPNGSGKTTLLKIILGILTPQKGSVYLFEKNLKEFSELYLIC